jgi:hypothetical protein
MQQQQQQQFFSRYESTCPKKCRRPHLSCERTRVRCRQGHVNARRLRRRRRRWRGGRSRRLLANVRAVKADVPGGTTGRRRRHASQSHTGRRVPAASVAVGQAAAAEEEEAATCRGSRVIPGLRGSAHEAVRQRVWAQRLPPSGIGRGVGGHILGDVIRGERWQRRPAGAVVVFLVDGVRARSAQARAVKAVPGKAARVTFCRRQAAARRWRWSISK